MPIGNAELIHNWRLSKLRLAKAKADELRWRMLIAMQCFRDPELGTNTAYCDANLKMVVKETYTLSKDNDAVEAAALSLWEKFDTERAHLSLLLKPTLDFNKAAYENLSEDAKKEFACVLTIKPATPTVTYKGEQE